MANEKTTFGAAFIQPQPDRNPRLDLAACQSHPPSEVDSMLATPNKEDIDPSSPFYQHPDLRRSMDSKERDRSRDHLTVDLEAGVPISAASTNQPNKISVDGRVKECTMWPSRQTLQEKAKARKAAKGGCNPMRNMSRTQKTWCKVLIALTVIAAAVGLGVGISRAVGGSVWSGKGQSTLIPSGRKT